jgi:hypothetical protein
MAAGGLEALAPLQARVAALRGGGSARVLLALARALAEDLAVRRAQRPLQGGSAPDDVSSAPVMAARLRALHLWLRAVPPPPRPAALEDAIYASITVLVALAAGDNFTETALAGLGTTDHVRGGWGGFFFDLIKP